MTEEGPDRGRSGRFADFHAPRHAAGSRLAAAGTSPEVVQAMRSHSDYQLTMNVQPHAIREDEASAVEMLPKVGLPKRRESTEGKSVLRS